jgi:beta-1,4-mannosyl-glycoprotein beta-1,4-N-acetylglucosaminyltransferase
MIYDTFLFLREFDLLEIRLRELDPVVDRFVIVESSKTFTGHDKPFYLDQQFDRFARWMPKIIRVKATDAPVDANATERERWTRNCIARGLSDLRPMDVVMISDLDEIPSNEAIARYHPRRGIVGFQQIVYRYYLNCLTEERWIGTRIVPARMMDCSPDYIRWHLADGTLIDMDGGWHFTSMGGSEEFAYKLASFSHAGCAWHPREIEAVRDGSFAAKYGLKVVEIDETYPRWVQENIDTVRRWGLLYEPAKELAPC